MVLSMLSIQINYLLRLAAKMAYRNAMPQANPVFLEPIMKLEVVTPEENMGDIVGDLNRRRGQVEGMDDKTWI